MRNTFENPRRLAATTAGIAVAVFLTISQVGLLASFVDAAQRVVTGAAAQIWIAPTGVVSLEYGAIQETRIGEMVLGIPGVRSVEPLAVGVVRWQASGKRSGVVLVGSTAAGRTALPAPDSSAGSSWVTPVALNGRNGVAIGVLSVPTSGEINGHGIEVTTALTDYASFLGNPYVFVAHREAQKLLGLLEDETTFALVFTEPDADVTEVARRIRERLPNQDVLTTAEFARRTSDFWLLRTGAGGGFLLTAMLGFAVGVVIVSQTLYTSVINRQLEYATLSAIGASAWDLRKLVMAEAMLFGVIGGSAGVLLSYPGIWLMRAQLVPWLRVGVGLRLSAVVVALVMSGLAATWALRVVVNHDPATVLRG